MRRTAIAILVLLASSLYPSAASAREGQSAPPFDRPLQTRHVRAGELEVRCYTYSRVMVKEIDAGEVGDQQISLVPITPPADRPPCQVKNLANEHVIPIESWSGYFHGAKDGYVFLSAGDGVNRGLGFSVYHGGDPASLFQDALKFERERGRFQSIAGDTAGLALHYTRVYTGPCSVQIDGAACWARIAAETHLPLASQPDCAAGYLRAKQELANARCEIAHRKNNTACIKREIDGMKADDASPSVIGYDVEVLIQPPQTSIRPAGGPVACWPAD